MRGFAIAVTAVALMYQWADTTRIALGRGIDAPNDRHALGVAVVVERVHRRAVTEEHGGHDLKVLDGHPPILAFGR